MATLRDVARQAEVSSATVSRALNGDPAVLPATRRRVLAAARRLGYRINPYVGQVLSSLRQGRRDVHKGNLAVLWFDSDPASERHPNLARMRGAMHARAGELGYTLDEFSRRHHTSKALLSILRSRGIRGLVIAPPFAAPGKTHLRMALDGLAAVSLGWAIVHPGLPSVRFDHYRSMTLALHHARHRFGRRIAAVWNFKAERRSDHVSLAAFLAHHPAGPGAASELFLDVNLAEPARTKSLFRRHRIECVISESEDAPDWLFRLIPPERCIHLARPHRQPCLAWMDPRYDLLGRWGIDLLTSMLQRGETGIPDDPKVILVPGAWNPSGRMQDRV